MPTASPTPATWRRHEQVSAEVFVQLQARQRTRPAGGSTPADSEDMMAEIAMAGGRGELRASDLTTGGYVTQGQR